MYKQRGFTLVELLVTLAIVAIVATFAVPSFSTLSANNRITATSNTLVGVFNLARAEAVKRSRIIRVSPRLGTNWSSGAVVWEDVNGDGALQDSEIIRSETFAGGDLSVAANAAVRFTGGGLSSTTPQVDICDGRTGETGRRLTISTGGRVRAEDLACS